MLIMRKRYEKSKATFGSGCTNNIFKFLNIEKPTRCKNKEQLLYKNIMKITNVSKINNNQKIWLTDRYLTYQYLNQLHYGDFENLKNINISFMNMNLKFDDLLLIGLLFLFYYEGVKDRFAYIIIFLLLIS